MGWQCCGTKSREEEEEEERKTSCLRCCALRKKKNNKGRRNWNPFACLRCRGKKVTCCSSSCCSNKPSEAGNGRNTSSADTKESRHDEKKKKKRRKFNRASCLPCLVCGEESGCCGRLRGCCGKKPGCCGWKPGCCAKSTEDNNIKLTEDGNNISPSDVNNNITPSADNNIKPSDVRKEGEKRNCLTCFVCRGKMLRSCFCCAKSSEEKKRPSKKKEPRKGSQLAFLVHSISFKSDGSKHRTAAEEILRIGNGNIAARVFQFRELAAATKNFKAECLLGEGGFGRVYQGELEDTNQIVAVKQLDRNGFQGNREFLVEVLMLSLLHHPNLVKLLGYCADGDQRILVYEYMPLGSLEDLLAPSPNRKPLDWNTRMKIALGSAKGLEYLHDIASPPVIYRDFKTSNILLDDEYNAKLSDFGLAKLGPIGDKNYVSTRVMGTYGYCAPEYALTGQLTKMSDIYSFGVVFLEIITGRKAIDITKPTDEQQLVHWAGPLFKDKTKFVEMADPLLLGKYPLKGLYQALAVASMCLQDEANIRPRISDVVTALEYLAIPSDDPNVVLKESTPIKVATPISAMETNTDGIQEMNDKADILQSQSNREDEIQMEVDIT